jgi:beta-phosphoglucomutase-like phosphatase (HAD superfamily)
VGDDGGVQRPTHPLDPLAFDAVLFDMDGTLIDSEPLWYEAISGVVPAYGGVVPAHGHQALHGQDRENSSRILREQFALQGDIDAFWLEVVARLGAALATVKPMPNAGAWVEGVVRAGLPTALVSNSPRAMIEASLAPQPWAPHLRVRVAIEDVPRGKPEPDGYLLAAARLGVRAERCLVVEDSFAGARAAIAAGATCLFVTNGAVPADSARDLTPHVVPALPAWVGPG